MGWARVAVGMVAIGCFRGDLPELPPDIIEFTPEAGEVSGVTVHTTRIGLTCPDGAPARLVLVRPDQADGALPVAVVFHSGAFDYVLDPDAAEPLAGVHYAAPTRLGETFAVQQVHATLGMFPDPVPEEVRTGTLVSTLLEAGAAVLLPGNCWGDLWGARSGLEGNDVARDFFRREGLTLAEWSLAALLDGTFAQTIGAELPIQVDPRRIYGIGLGSGGRAVMELLAVDRNLDGSGDIAFAGIVLDSSPDDLSTYIDDPGVDLDRARGIARIFPDGDVERGSIATAVDLPERVAYIYSSQDPVWPVSVHDAAVSRLKGVPGTLVRDVGVDTHGVLDGGGPAEVTVEVVEYLLEP